MSSPTLAIPPEVLEALALPELDGLTEGKARGRDCVWGGGQLTIESAVDLGEQLAAADSASLIGERWFPRACRRCIARRAHGALLTHATSCTACARAETSATCAVGRGLYRVSREYRS
ncbi:hypothetical protein [Streptomyces sp. NPDC005732]|uniref:hypothetical protein n=1 Tax=Streptomyces sp. NPDC005732 TaxID=3157057 RepID=UPI0033C94E3C